VKLTTKVPAWSSLRKVGESAFSKSFNYWLIIVPLAAKSLSAIEYVSFSLGGEIHKIHLSLPFSWSILFFAALFYACGNLIYTIFCPSWIKQYSDFEEFKKSGQGQEATIKLLIARLQAKNYSPEDVNGILYEFFLKYTEKNHYLERMTFIDFARAYEREEMKIRESALGDAFWFIRGHYDLAQPKARLLTLISYTIGNLLLGWIMAQNLRFVLDHFWNK